MAAPIVCCLAGLAVVTLLHHRQASLAARYAAMHLVPWPQAQGWMGEPSSFLHGAGPGQEIFMRNPGQWRTDIAMASFAMTPILVIGLAAVAYGLATRRRAAVVGGLLPVAGVIWFAFAPLHMILFGREMVLDANRNSLTINGGPVVALSDVEGFVGQETHRAKGGADFFLYAVVRGGRLVGLQGPDARPDMVGAGVPLTAALQRLRGKTAATPRCPGATCIQTPPGTVAGLRARIGAVQGADAPDPGASAP